MQPCYYIVESQTSAKLPASIREATAAEFEQTAQEHWQTDWRTDFIQDAALEKYALELDATKELVGLAAYRDMPEGVLVYVEYMESAPSGNPTLSKPRKYAGIGAALLALGLSAGEDSEYGLYVMTVNGGSVDYDKDGKYWAFYVDGEYAATGVDSTEMSACETYTFKAE